MILYIRWLIQANYREVERLKARIMSRYNENNAMLSKECKLKANKNKHLVYRMIKEVK